MISPSRLSADLLGPEDAAPAPSDPCELLGRLFGLRGTVEMCAFLDERPGPAVPARRRTRVVDGAPAASDAPVGEAGDRRTALEELTRLENRPRSIRSLALRPLADPFSGRSAMPGPEETLGQLLSGGLLGRRRRGAIDRLASDLAGAFHGMIGTRIAIARAAFDEAREEAAGWLQTLGAASGYLADLDAALRRATEVQARELFTRVPAALHRRFRDRLALAVADLPEEPPLEAIEAWYAPASEGWVIEHIGVCRRVVEDASRHEARPFKALLAGARELGSAEPSRRDEP